MIIVQLGRRLNISDNSDTIADSALRKLYNDELPEFLDSLKSIDNLPRTIQKSISATKKNIKKSAKVIESAADEAILDAGIGAGIVGAVAGIIFDKLEKKRKSKKYSGVELIAIKDNASQFDDTIQRMQQLLGKGNSAKPDYKQLSPQEQSELLLLAEEMKQLSQELASELAA